MSKLNEAFENLKSAMIQELDKRDFAQARLIMDLMDNVCTLSGGKDILSAKEQAFARSGQKIEAIKEVRSRTGLGLKEAKDLVENWIEKMGIPPPRFP